MAVRNFYETKKALPKEGLLSDASDLQKFYSNDYSGNNDGFQ